MEFRNGVCGAERKSQVEGCGERLSCSSRGFSRAPQGGRDQVPLVWIRPEEFPGYWRTCRGPDVSGPRVHFYHNRPESLLVTLPTHAQGLWAELPDWGQEFSPGPLLCPGTCVEAAASSKMSVPSCRVSPHSAAVNHALPTTIPITKKQQRHLPEAFIILVSSESVPSSYTEQEHLTLKEGAQT